VNSPVGYEDLEAAPAPLALPPWPFLGTLPAALGASENPVAAFRQALADGDASLKQRFAEDEPVEGLVRDRARMVDVVLKGAWDLHVGPHARDVNLIAVGGYGRGELHPCSDIDVLILLPKSEVVEAEAGIERFLTFLWDIGLEVGHSVRTIDDCQRESAADVSVATTFIEARLLAGPDHLFQSMRRALGQDKVWSSKAFFEAKVAEQQARHHRYHDTGYNLEPNVKASPGGLRDIQTIGWVAKRHFGAETLDELVGHGFLTAAELRKLRQAQAFLWKVRFALHTLTGRREDRLLFDHQIRIAKMFGYEDATYTLAVEQFMQRYYRTVMDVSLLNEMLLQLFREAILNGAGEGTIVPLNPRFQLRNDYLEVTAEDTFVRNPSAILELFRVMQDTPEARGVRAPAPLADRRGIPPEPAAPPAVPRDPARARGRHARAAAHEPLRRARSLHPRVRTRRRSHAVRPVPRLHGRRAHPVRAAQPAPPGPAALRARTARDVAAHGHDPAPGSRLPRGTVPRRRQGSRR
jgi:[protein-PII] uridylyltransferase